MMKTITSLTRSFANTLYNIASWLKGKDRSVKFQSKFVDLAPTDDADNSGVYSEAILFAMTSSKVSNIALTGPYGSGKSSIIQSFLKQYRRPSLHISLASFVPEMADTGDEQVSRQEIERSILQQMLYGADTNKLPLSRFKRIQSPGMGAVFKSLYIMLGIIAFWYVFHKREDIMSGNFFVPLALSNTLHLSIFTFAAIFFWVTVHHFYVASFGLSLKSISLKDVEIRPAYEDQTSILNRHLDEIIYFFQSTAYELVIIEDLDRFNNAEIFVTLREINRLVNENACVKRPIRFLYALRDDMFANTDRTKFFEFIIPVIPIINASNSIDMVLRQGRRLELDRRLDTQFLREVSRYLNDLRLIQNIFNEYAIYVANLETDEEDILDANKLLAILIYKNVYPRDFEQLHRGAGTLAGILGRKEEFIRNSEALYRAEITELEEGIEIAERQTPSDLRELRQIYAMDILQMLPTNTISSVSIEGNKWITFSQMIENDTFERLIENQNIFYRDFHNHRHSLSISSLQGRVDFHRSYYRRKLEIESKATNNKNNSLNRIRDLRSLITKLRTAKLNELIRTNTNRDEDIFKDFGESGDLARFLILEGHIDDTYYQYTSLFHSGRLSPNDNKFLIRIRAFVTPEPNFPIDNPKEVIAEMRDEDFRQSYVLNVTLVDSLLSDESFYRTQTQSLLGFLSSKFENSEDFLDTYYANGRHIVELLLGLARTWEGFVPAVINSPRNLSHVTQLISHVPKYMLEKLAKNFDELPKFVSKNISEILVSSPELKPEILGCLDVEIKDIASIKEHSEIVRFIFEEGRFELTTLNLEYIYQAILGKSNLDSLRERNYTTIRATKNKFLLKRVECDFNRYFNDILLDLESNSKEDVSAILSLVCHDELNQDDLRKFLGRQEVLLPSLADIPDRLHAMVFQLGKIKPNWMNCLSFMRSERFEAEGLIDYLDRNEVRVTILSEPIPSDSDSFQLREFLINAGALSDSSYRNYVHALPKAFENPPSGLEPAKLLILIDEAKITFTKKSLDALADNRELQVRFVATNIGKYLEDPDSFSLDDEFREELLRSEIDIAAKFKIIKLMNLELLVSLPQRSALIGPIINSNETQIYNIDSNIAQSLIANSTPLATQLSLFNKYHILMTDDEVRDILANLPKPFSEIKLGYHTPKLQNTPENQDLVRWLDSRNIISSWSIGDFFTDSIRINLYRPR